MLSVLRAHMGLKTMDSEGQQALRWWDFPHQFQQPRGWEEGKGKRMVIPPAARKDTPLLQLPHD